MRYRIVRRSASIATDSLRFFGNDNGTGTTGIDRVLITADGSQPVNVGATDFAYDGWLRTASGNNAGDFLVGANYSWPSGNIFIDRDRFGLVRSYGISLSQGRITFGVRSPSNSIFTIRGTTDVRTGNWLHYRVQRRFSDGQLSIYVNGTQDASGSGPTGDMSCPAGDSPDDALCLGAEKFDADLTGSPSYFGWLGELLVERVYVTSNFTPPTQPRTVNGNTAALYRWATQTGTAAADENGNQSPGTLFQGGANNGPQWSALTPYA